MAGHRRWRGRSSSSNQSEDGLRAGLGQVALIRSATIRSPPAAVGTLERTEARPADGTGEKTEKAESPEGQSREAARDAGARTGAPPSVTPIITGRLLIFLVAVVAVLAGAWGLVRLYLDSSYFLAMTRARSSSIRESREASSGSTRKPSTGPGSLPRRCRRTRSRVSKTVRFTESSAAAAQALVRRMVMTQMRL